MIKESLLTMEGAYFPSCSLRECIQELFPLHKTNLFKRTVNGELIYLGETCDMKYASKITCSDENFPAISHLWRGSVVKVGFILPLSQTLKGGMGEILKPVVPGTLSICHPKGDSIEFSQKGQEITLNSKDEVIVSYRPLLFMRITGFSYVRKEWEGKSTWTLELEEI